MTHSIEQEVGYEKKFPFQQNPYRREHHSGHHHGHHESHHGHHKSGWLHLIVFSVVGASVLGYVISAMI